MTQVFSFLKRPFEIPAKQLWFALFKYSLYSILLVNMVYFFIEDHEASSYLFNGGVDFTIFADAYATFLDSAAWILLLLCFELETFIIPDEKLTLPVKLFLNSLIALGYSLVILAFTGYYDRAETMHDFTPIPEVNACALVGKVELLARDIDIYEPLTVENCGDLPIGPLFVNQVNAESKLLAPQKTEARMRLLSVLDVVNSGSWVLIVFVLWIDVVLQASGFLSNNFYRVNLAVKALLYSILILACLYWVWEAAWIDAWDAAIWILAFFAIELNLFNWHEHNMSEKISPPTSPLNRAETS